MMASLKPSIELIHRYNNSAIQSLHEDCWIIMFKLGEEVLYTNLSSNTLLEAIEILRKGANDLSWFKGCTISIISRTENEYIEEWDEEKLIYILLKYS